MFRIKICGVTTPEDAAVVRQAGADAIGVNFYPKSPRYLAPDGAAAAAVREAAGPGLTCVAVYVNETPGTINQHLQRPGPGPVAAQLHGEEEPRDLAALSPGGVVVRARRLGAGGVAAIGADLAACRDAGRAPDAVLVDALVAGQYGGTGKRVDWDALAGFRKTLGDVPMILAGGLTPANVAEAIRAVQPDGVDTASGVEISPGRKDPELVKRFVAAAAAAFDRIGSV